MKRQVWGWGSCKAGTLPPKVALSVLALAEAMATPAQANTIVEFTTPLGAFDVSLYDTVAPASVANFMAYVVSHRYDGALVHRSEPGFIIQGGGYYADFSSVPGFAPVVNEASLSNVRGTIAMAHSQANVNNATSQWFINTANNSLIDPGQWAVFGVVMGNGMEVVDAIAALPTYDYSALNPALAELPVRNFNAAPGSLPAVQNLVTVSISVVPETGTAALFGLGLLTLGFWRARSSAGAAMPLNPSA
jgi:cyclophilin family peptidyl-prolyl cis-trans isomerase